MPRNGSGTYTLPAGNPVVTGTTISSSWANTTLSDLATAMTSSISKDGQTTPTANLPMGTYKFTNLGAGSAATDSANLAQVQNGAVTTLNSVSGADTITAVASPTLTAYAAGNNFRFISVGANTGAVTLNIDSLGAKSIKKFGSTDLAASDIPSGAAVDVFYDGTQFQLIGLAASSISSTATATTQSANDNSTKIATTAYVDRVKDKLFDVDATVAANAMTLTINPCVLDFRSTTLTDGTPVTRTISAAINTVISSGSTGGTTSGAQSDIVIAGIDNAGTVEVAWTNLAGGQDLSETGLISTTAEGGAGGADSASTWYSTTARTNVAYRVLGIARSTQATAGTWATTPSLVQPTGGQAIFRSASMVRLNTANGYGSTNTRIRRFTNVVTNQGADITYADSATLGASFTINTNGVYAVSYSDQFTAADAAAITLNDTNPTTTPVVGETLAVDQTSGTNAPSNTAWSGYLVAGSVIRARSVSGVAAGANTFANQFTIVRVA